jgi:glycosyltransferase involved in cell wall biosynthesis
MPEGAAQPPVSVLISTRNRADDIACILPGARAQEYPDYEIVIVDQSTNDETEKVVAEHAREDSRIRYLHMDVAGASLARNTSIELAKHEYCTLTDDDCELGPRWVANVASTFESHPETHVIFGPVHIPEGDFDHEEYICPCLYFDTERVLNPGEVYGMGANMAVRRSFMQRVGPYDLILGPGAPFFAGEEHDWMYRAHKFGAVIRLTPNNSVIHRALRNRKEWQRVLYCYGVGDAGYMMKHWRCGDPGLVRPMFSRFSTNALRTVARALRGRPRNEQNYLRGFSTGVRMSRQYKIDCEKRLYIKPQ